MIGLGRTRGGATGDKMAPVVGYACVAAAVWLAWEVIKVPVVDRAGPAIAVRLAPRSPEVLRAAAEEEFAARRYDNARALSEASLARAPFNARALRVRGLVEAQGPDSARADSLLTLAGNWSLRDDPAHAWLMDYRLRNGDYQSAFAHADTLARRRTDLYPQIFNLFTTAALSDPRSTPHLARLLAAFPPWRHTFLNSLHARDDGDPVLAELAIRLQRTQRPFTDAELGHLYRTWAAEGRYPGIRFLRTELRRPPPGEALQNADFEKDAIPDFLPFQWRLAAAPGVSAQIIEDDLGRNGGALRVDHDGRRASVLAEQLMVLDPGQHVLTGEWRFETPSDGGNVGWTVLCAETGRPIGTRPVEGTGAVEPGWRSWSLTLNVPSSGCSAQWLRLEAAAGDSSDRTVIWYDNLRMDS